LLGVIQFGGAAGLLPEDIVDVFEGLFKHKGSNRQIIVVRPDGARDANLTGMDVTGTQAKKKPVLTRAFLLSLDFSL
jgi:hypothetical protein